MPIILAIADADEAPTLTPVAVSTIVTKAGNLLLDDSHVRWGVDELIRWTAEAMSAILHLRPDAFARTGTFTLTDGTLQVLPLGAVGLLDVTRNVVDGNPGRAVRLTDRKSIDDANPDWHSSTPSSTIRHFMYDPRTPRSFYVYPPANGGAKLEIKYVGLPPDVTAETDTIPVGSEFIPAIVNYVCYRCNLKDSEFANASVANLFYQAFTASLGLSPTPAAA